MQPECLHSVSYTHLAAVAHADFVVICVRASKENENLINAAQLAAMKRGAILVNIARGMLIDETALVDAVTHGQISAAGLDVLKNEPTNRMDPLLQLPQVLVTPHIAGLTDPVSYTHLDVYKRQL